MTSALLYNFNKKKKSVDVELEEVYNDPKEHDRENSDGKTDQKAKSYWYGGAEGKQRHWSF